ncbi:hypothetical protein QYE76_009642 [Lolium multiflorum]|uniref:Transmembrane protein n=1 Tax=Lolium multiflorum TaxID=4521 RepID=A0AAD8X296_LOLMU|nr:hypothetical protein QYE76_009642 [Lolium multiflorum]
MYIAADVENPNNPGGGLQGVAAAPEPDEQSQFDLVCCMLCIACTVLAASASLVVLFCLSAHASTILRVLAGFGLVVGIIGLAFGACFCAHVALTCIHGNSEGTRQDEAPRVAA